MKNNKNIFLGFAWISLICAVGSWLLTPFLLFGLEIVAIIFGAIALIISEKSQKRGRRVAKFGFWIGILKLVFVVSFFVYLFIAFMINPVAH